MRATISTLCLVAIAVTVVLAFGDIARNKFNAATKPRRFITVTAAENEAACDKRYEFTRWSLADAYQRCVSRGAHTIEVQ
jgi:hypothetical protein